MKGLNKMGVLLFAVLGSLIACREIPDQTIVKPEHFEIANPKPAPRDFAKINANHKVLVGVFDSGVDYNHPDLIKNTHFELDHMGRPVGYGYDYLGQDNWSSYRIVNTALYEYKDQSADEKGSVDRESDPAEFDRDVKSELAKAQCLNSAVVKAEPKLSKFISPFREKGFEAAGEAIHGTHVAGLTTYDRPDIGLVSYRVLPYHLTKATERDENLLRTSIFVNNLADALERSQKLQDNRGRGVRVVNLSIGGSLGRPNSSEGETNERDMERFNRARTLIYTSLTDLVKKYPQVLFVAAAGNDSGWSDNRTRVQYPCGIEAENILCVGATNKDEELSTFTNIPLNDVELVFAPGYDIKSTFPTDQCRALNQFMNGMMNYNTSAPACKYDNKNKSWQVDDERLGVLKPMIKALVRSCETSHNKYINMSGTSMATPIVTRLAAEILADQDLTPAQVIQVIKKMAKPRQGRQFTAYVLEQSDLESPTWEPKMFSKSEPIPVRIR